MFAAAAAEWSHTARVDDGHWRVRYRAAGMGPPVVLAHGLGVSADYWWRNGPALAAAGFRVLAPDLPGFGRTRGPTRGLGVPEQAAALARFAEAMSLGRAVFVGHSVSCQSVLWLAAEQPERVRALVLASPTGDRRRLRWLREMWGFLRDIPREPTSLVPIVATAYLRAGPRRYWRTWRAVDADDPFRNATRARAPSCVIVGERDPLVPHPFARALAEALPKSHFVVIPGGAHAVIYDQPEAFNAVVTTFLRTLPAETAE